MKIGAANIYSLGNKANVLIIPKKRHEASQHFFVYEKRLFILFIHALLKWFSHGPTTEGQINKIK
jgi:hypothetical protein